MDTRADRAAHSDDGDHWAKVAVVLSPDPQTWKDRISRPMTALAFQRHLYYWYVAGPKERPQIGLARDWRKERAPVLEPGPYMSGMRWGWRILT